MEQENDIDFTGIFEVLNKEKAMIAAVTIFFVLFSAILSFFIIKPTYQGHVTVIIGKNDSKSSTNEQYNDVMMSQNLTKTYAQIAQSKQVADKTVSKLADGTTADQVLGLVSVTPQTGTQIIDITANGKSPDKAADLANDFSDSFVEVSKAVYTAGDARIIDRATAPKSPIKPKKMINIAIAFILGLFISVGIAFIKEYMDKTIKTQEDIKKHLDLPVLGVIPNYEEE
ncbi:capsular polysaccharide biosynthesis protein [Clostridium acetobutylicum]|uniref:CPSD/CAPA conserved membrane protein of Rol/Cld family n=1 Tax=Clostridium acetobutylicum (strain ATCC 824 / DSM 792 / JCM 1419 / IAM 19013 / LMG 5710 / NBRC 13948 / NRRL B-527 / VKM B-1787 / 2291 / W) TaxID=272562 RepID=Q97ER4_CLOAB|nr:MULTISPECIES: YveK family protein [Clostridium]AAK80984.1 CPSD/CAPA conserved membrane protein of Rol/Cld family [Clostridium acetobutylicum ATCC 824]AEI34587.1 Rol/Cld family membrane protein [Clostridium acetobutylicum DSM 1731]AWV78605.1 capsular biosynthesis protein [Clostridium acetobutylicum]KHD35759.1 capsular biosynthesis protein [Clostridium acetobutylicum]MBC2393465.1 capsular biosynthesis protein [Clostridium acetobutylicum]